MEIRAVSFGGREQVLAVHPGSVILIPILSDGRIIMIRNNRYAIGSKVLELPAGTLDVGEEPIVCAARELAEETGYQAATLDPIGWFYASPGFSTERMHVYVATSLVEVGQSLECDESIDVFPMTVDEIHTAIRGGELCDAKTLAAFHLHAGRGSTCAPVVRPSYPGA